MKRLIVFFLLTACALASKAQLVINEVSQGTSGNKEYIELVVIRTNCTDTCADLRGWIVDDNGGWFGSSAVSNGCIRFKNNSTWDCVPFGSIILIYNQGDKNGLITQPDDPTDANNDRVYILPVNSAELEMNPSNPSGGTSFSYPSTGFTATGNWTNLAMNNNGDAVVVVNPANPAAAYHSMSYGSITGATGAAQILISGNNRVVYNNGSNWNIVNASTGFTSGAAPASETPGAGNSAANTTWINALKVNSFGTVNKNIADTICQGQTYTFNGTVLNTGGIYKDTFTAASGCDSIVTLNLFVRPLPPAPTVNSPVDYCQFETAAALTAAGANLKWYTQLTGGTALPAAPVPNTNTAGTQQFYVSQTLNGCEGPRSLITVNIKPKPAAPGVSPIILCKGAVALPLTATGQNLRWYSSSTGGVGATTAPIPSTATDGNTTYYVSQTINGCESDRIALIVTVASVTASFTTDKDTLCAGVGIQFTATSTSSAALPLTHQWNFDNGFAEVGAGPVHTYTTPGLYRPRLISTDPNGCTDSVRKTILIIPTPSVSFQVSDSSICAGDSISIRSVLTPGYISLLWDFGDDTFTDSLEQPGHAYDTAGNYRILLSAEYRHCPTRRDTAGVLVNAYPQVTLGPDTSICLGGEPVQIVNSSAEAGIPMRWNTGATSASILVRHHGVYYCTATDAGCSTTDTVTVFKSCYIDIPNAFTPNDDGINDYFFPRQLLSKAVTKFEMQVFNRWGQLIFETTRPDGRGWDGRLNGQPQPSGVYVYLIKVNFANEQGEAYQGNVTLLR